MAAMCFAETGYTDRSGSDRPILEHMVDEFLRAFLKEDRSDAMSGIEITSKLLSPVDKMKFTEAKEPDRDNTSESNTEPKIIQYSEHIGVVPCRVFDDHEQREKKPERQGPLAPSLFSH
jgi:hypothetical protein